MPDHGRSASAGPDTADPTLAEVSRLARDSRDAGPAAAGGRADATHTWVLLWCGPARGWVGIDPTNGIWMASNHVIVAIGRDYADIAPIDGIVLGSGAQDMQVSVVDVEPLEVAG